MDNRIKGGDAVDRGTEGGRSSGQDNRRWWEQWPKDLRVVGAVAKTTEGDGSTGHKTESSSA